MAQPQPCNPARRQRQLGTPALLFDAARRRLRSACAARVRTAILALVLVLSAAKFPYVVHGHYPIGQWLFWRYARSRRLHRPHRLPGYASMLKERRPLKSWPGPGSSSPSRAAIPRLKRRCRPRFSKAQRGESCSYRRACANDAAAPRKLRRVAASAPCVDPRE